MRRDTLFELRVLTGVHAGARSLLSGEPQVLGSGEDCDLILSDEGVLARHARLEYREDGSAVLSWLEGDLAPLLIRPGQGAALGPVHIAVEASDAPWRDDLEVLGLAPGDAPHDDSLHDGGEAVDGLGAPDPQAQAAGTQAHAQTAAGAGRRRLRTVTAASALALAAAVVAGWLLRPQHAPEGPPAEAATNPPAAAAAAAAADRASTAVGATGGDAAQPALQVPKALAETLARQGLGDRVHALARSGRTPLVQGTLLSDDETERLAIALSRLQPRPGLRLVSMSDLQAQADAALQEALDGAPPDSLAGARPVRAIHVADGRFRIEGRVADEAVRERLLERLAQAPDLRGVESAVVTQADVAAALLADLRAQGIGQVDGHWGDGVLALSVHLGPGELAQWERTLVAAAARHPLPLRASVQVAQAPPPPAPPPQEILVLPFKVRSVISSDTPFIVLDDATKVGVGGVARGWRVAEINANAVVFEDPRQRRLIFQR